MRYVSYKCEVLGRNPHIGDAMFITSENTKEGED